MKKICRLDKGSAKRNQKAANQKRKGGNGRHPWVYLWEAPSSSVDESSVGRRLQSHRMPEWGAVHADSHSRDLVGICFRTRRGVGLRPSALSRGDEPQIAAKIQTQNKIAKKKTTRDRLAACPEPATLPGMHGGYANGGTQGGDDHTEGATTEERNREERGGEK